MKNLRKQGKNPYDPTYKKTITSYLQPRNIPPSAIENTIKYGKKTKAVNNTWDYTTKHLKIVINSKGNVITVHKIGGKK